MDSSDKIVNKLTKKAATKQEVYRVSKSVFETLKEVISELSEVLSKEISSLDKHVEIKYINKGEFEIQLKFSGDTLIFHMHTNTFSFDKSHQIWKSSYVKEDEYRAYCGVINIYNFLSDSFKYNRINDLGFMIGRLYINKEKHFFTEGNGRMSFLYNNFQNDILDKKVLKNIVNELMLYAMDDELISPPLKEVQVVSLNQINQMSQNMKLKTAKKLGFKFSNEK
jgi:histone H3/H4